MIVCITEIVKLPSGRRERRVSHGYDYHTGEVVILQWEDPHVLGAIYHPEICEWVILGKGETI